MNKASVGLHFLRDAYSKLFFYAEEALRRQEWNTAANLAYESMEKTAKVLEYLTGIRTANGHHVRITDEMVELAPLSAWIEGRGIHNNEGVWVFKRRHPSPHVQIGKSNGDVFTVLGTRQIGSFAQLRLTIHGSTLKLFEGELFRFSCTDTSVVTPMLYGTWVQLFVSNERVAVLNKHLGTVSKGRNETDYYATMFNESSARRVIDDARSLYGPVRGRLGERLRA